MVAPAAQHTAAPSTFPLITNQFCKGCCHCSKKGRKNISSSMGDLK